MTIRSAAEKAREKEERRARGEPAKGDRTKGYGKDKPPKGGRNSNGRGRTR